jgi:hypothetical protein
MTNRWLAAFFSDSPYPQDKSDKTGQNPVSSPFVAFVPGIERITKSADDEERDAIADILRRADRALSVEALADQAELTIRSEALP